METFDHLSDLEINVGATTRVELPEVAPKAVLIVKPATEANAPYFNAMLRRTGARARRMARTDRITAEDAEMNRADDRELFPRYVLVNWEGIVTKAGEPVPFNADNAREFCAKLPAWLFDRVRNQAATPERFLEAGDDLPDTKALSGN